MKGFIAVFKEKQTGLLNTISTWDSSRFYKESLEEIAEMEANEDYINEQLFMFTDHNLFLKKRLLPNELYQYYMRVYQHQEILVQHHIELSVKLLLGSHKQL